MKRIYDSLLAEHIKNNRQMAFLTGPRQVGKTTTSQSGEGKKIYLNWDNPSDRLLVSSGSGSIAEELNFADLKKNPEIIIFDELHKYPKWKSFLKGFFDVYGDDCRTIVTGSARLNIYKPGGDSLMGRYFLYRMHPVTIGELINTDLSDREIKQPQKTDKDTIKQLIQFGGFPEPFLKNDTRFFNRWKKLRTEQLFHEDLRDLSRIHEVKQVEMLAELLKSRVGQLVNYSNLASAINVSVDTVRRWLATLESMYYCFSIRPWFSNVPKSLRKQPKIYLWDWSSVAEPGARYENLTASHLLKAVHLWTDMGLGDYQLYFLRDKMKREVDFLVTKDGVPWFIVEVKTSGSKRINPNLEYFQQLLKCPHAFQVVSDMEFVERDCFSIEKPVRVPDLTFFSQLV